MSEDLYITYTAPETLAPYARNARTHTKDQIRQIARSIRSFGFINPVIVDSKGMIVAGHARVLAAMELGLSKVPVIQIDNLSEAQKRAYILADNKLAENAGWDNDLLRVELEYLSRVNVDIDVDLTGFSVPELDLLFSPANDASEPEEPPPWPPSPVETVSRTDDLWQLGPHRIICGDCRDPAVIDLLMAEEQARMVITDPPYNVPIDGHVGGLGKHHHPDFAMASGEMSSAVFSNFLVEALGQLARVSTEGSLHYVFMDWRHISELLAAGDQAYDKLLNLCVWAKTNGGMGSLYRSQHELVFLFKKGQAPHLNNIELGKHGRYRTNLWSYAGVNAFGSERNQALDMHPTVKPVRMIADAICDVSRRGDIVLDGFLGSGTTLIAAEQTARICYGVEIDPRYVDVALRRWAEATGTSPIRLASGKSFEAVAAGRSETSAQGA